MPSALEDASFVQQAKDAGYTPDEIYGHLAQHNPAFKKIKEAGYSFDEVYQHIYSKAQEQAVSMQEGATGIGTPVGGMLAELSGGLKVDPLTKDMHEFLDTVPPDLEKKMVDTINAHSEEDWKKEVGPVMADQLRQHYAQRAQGVSDADQPLVYLPKPQGTGAVATITRGAEQSVEGLETLKNIGLLGATMVLPKPLQKVVGKAFLALMAKGVVGDVETALDPTKTRSERLEATGRATAGGLLVGLGAKAEFGRPTEGGATPAERSGGMTPEEADRAAAQNELKTLAPQTAQAVEPKPQGQPEILDGLTLARRKLVEGFADAPPEQQKVRQMIIDHVDDILLSHDKNAVSESAERTARQPESTPPATPAAGGETALSPSAESTDIEALKQQMRAGRAPLTAEVVETPKGAAPTLESDSATAKRPRAEYEARVASVTDQEIIDSLEGQAALLKLSASNIDVGGETVFPARTEIPDFTRVKLGVYYKEAMRRGLSVPESPGLNAYVGRNVLGYVRKSSPPPQVESEPAPAAGKKTVADEKTGPAEVTLTRQSPMDQLKALNEDLTKGGDSVEKENAEENEEKGQVKPEPAAVQSSAQVSPGEKMVSDLQKLGRVNRDPAKSVASELKYYSNEERQQLQEHLGTKDAEPETLAKVITGKPKIKETSRPSEYVDEPAGKEGRGHPTADVAKEAFGEEYTGGPGAMGPREAEAQKAAQSYTSNKNSDVDAKRVARGLQPMMSAAKKALGVVWDEAMRRIDRDPNAGRSLVEEINRKPRAITGVEEATMLHHRIDISNDLENETRIALDPESTPAEKTEASVRSAALMDHLNEIDSASKAAGTEWGRSGRFRQQLVAEDYSLARMLQKKQLANGGEPLTPEQTADVGAMNKRIADLEQKVKEHEEQAEVQRQAVKDAQADAEIARMAREQTPAEKYAQGLLDRIQGGLKTEADKARARIRARLGNANALLDPVVLYDVAVIGAEKLFSAGLDFGKWSKSMIEEIGEDVRPHLEELFKTSQKINNDAVDRIAPKEMREKIKAKPKTDAEARENIVASIKDKAGQKENVGSKIQELALNFVRSGITDREKLVEAVHGAVKEALPEATSRDIRDVISGYGDYKELSKEEAKVTLRDLKGQMQQVSKIEDMTQKGVLPPKTGVERRLPSAEERGLAKEVNRIKKELGLNSTDPNQLKGALDAVKTRLKNRIEDLQQAIAKKEKISSSGKKVADDAEAADLRRQKDAAQKEYDAVFAEPKPTQQIEAGKAQQAVDRAAAALDRQQRINSGEIKPEPKEKVQPLSVLEKELRDRTEALREAKRKADAYRSPEDVAADKAQKGVDAAATALDRWDRIAKGGLTPETKTPKEPGSSLEEELRAQTEVIKEAVRESNRKPTDEQTQQIKALEKATEEYHRRAAAGEIEGKGKMLNRPDTELVAKAREARDAAKKILDDLRAAAKPKLTPEQIALKIYKTRTASRIADLQDRLAKGDFKPRERKPIELDAEGQRLKAEAEKAKLEFDRGNAKDRLASRSTTEKVLDTTPKVSRAFLLSNPITLAKLTAAAVWRMAITPIEEVAGAGLAKIPLISDIAERAPREGGGFNVRAESKALTEGFTKGMKDAYETLTKGETSMDVAGGKRNIVPHEWIDFIGGIHGALKSVTKRNEFARSFEKRVQFNLDHGVDVTDPAVQARLAMESYKDAQRSIFQQDNGLVLRYNRFLTSLEEKSKVTGRPSLGRKVAQSTLKTLLPIVKIPTNIVAEAFQYAVGSVTGSVRLTQAFRNGIETLKPEEADLIMRELKKGSLGGAVMLLGFLAPQVIGGYYQYGKKRSADDVKPGEIKIHGQEIPGFLLHNPLLEQFQIGSTIRRVADSKLRKRDQGTQGVSAGIFAAALGLTSEVPFVRETTEVAKAFNPYQRGQFVGELAKSRLEPQIIQSIAKWTDRDAQGNPVDRHPETFAQYMESGLPGLRKNVPEKEAASGYKVRKKRR